MFSGILLWFGAVFSLRDGLHSLYCDSCPSVGVQALPGALHLSHHQSHHQTLLEQSSGGSDSSWSHRQTQNSEWRNSFFKIFFIVQSDVSKIVTGSLTTQLVWSQVHSSFYVYGFLFLRLNVMEQPTAPQPTDRRQWPIKKQTDRCHGCTIIYWIWIIFVDISFWLGFCKLSLSCSCNTDQ